MDNFPIRLSRWTCFLPRTFTTL